MTSKTTVADPRAVANVSSSGKALPREKLPIITAKNTVTTSPAESSQSMILVEPYLQTQLLISERDNCCREMVFHALTKMPVHKWRR